MTHETVRHSPDEIAEFRERQKWKRAKLRKQMGLPDQEPAREAPRLEGPVGDHGGEAEGFVGNPNELVVKASTRILCKDIMDKIWRVYPFFRWAVQPSERGQIINLFCLDLHTEYGFTILLKDIMNDPSRRLAIHGAAEILERCGYEHRDAKGKLTFDKDTIRFLPRDLRGNVFVEAEDDHANKQRKRMEIEKAVADGRAQIITLENGEKLARVVDYNQLKV